MLLEVNKGSSTITLSMPKFFISSNFSAKALAFFISNSILSSGSGLTLGEKCVSYNNSSLCQSNNAHPIVFVDTSEPPTAADNVIELLGSV